MNILVYAKYLERGNKKMNELVRAHEKEAPDAIVHFASSNHVLLTDGYQYKTVTGLKNLRTRSWDKIYVDETLEAGHDELMHFMKYPEEITTF